VTGVYANSFYLAGIVSVVAALLVIPAWRCMKYNEYEVNIDEEEEVPFSTPSLPKSPEQAKKSILDIHKSFLSIYDVAISREDLYKIGHHHERHHHERHQAHARKAVASPDLRRLALTNATVCQSTESLRT
jgi:hypothetical protein